ncbi:MAG: class E sortase [Pseudolysinimonas sp.]|uniref:class E sortase n=1 Tax=Pseudolysinimonas sp. TaxID=2680009 RepID=UPI0032658B3C
MTQGDGTGLVHSPRRAARVQRVAKRRLSVVGILGELLITGGVLVLAFLGWQIWLGDLIMGTQLDSEGAQQSQAWQGHDYGTGGATADPTDPPVQAPPANAVPFANLIIPRFGADFDRKIAQGIGVPDVLNKGFIGHYPTTQMPGELGNFALASHRTSGGGNFHIIHELHVGDHIYVETQDGWYQYTFRNIEYVHPSGVGVIDPVPQFDGMEPTARYITLTTCNPFFSTAERLIAFGVFDRFYPRETAAANGGAPDEIAATVTGAG